MIFLLFIDIGLSANISTEELLKILGVGVSHHVSLLNTEVLEELQFSSLLESSLKEWPWDITHLFGGISDKCKLRCGRSPKSFQNTKTITLSNDIVFSAPILFPKLFCFYVYLKRTNPEKPRRPHTTGHELYQLNALTRNTQFDTPTPKTPTPN